MIWGLIQRWNAARKLAKGQCDNCSKPLPDTGAPSDFHTCSEECALERWASVTG